MRFIELVCDRRNDEFDGGYEKFKIIVNLDDISMLRCGVYLAMKGSHGVYSYHLTPESANKLKGILLGNDMKIEEVSKNETPEEKEDLYCTRCQHFEFTGDPEDNWYGTRCNKDGHEHPGSMYAIEECFKKCPLRKDKE